MKLVHPNKSKQAENPEENEIKLLEAIIRSHPTNEKAYNRLMILHRKDKNYKKELQTINLAIQTFEKKFNEKKQVFNKKVGALSKALLKATGLADKKGENIFQLGELTKWKKRKLLVQKRISNTKKQKE